MMAFDTNFSCISKQPKNVFFTNEHGGLGGGEIALLQHMASCIQLGYVAHLLVLEDGPFLQKAKELNCQVHLLPFSWQGNKFKSLLLILKNIAKSLILCLKFKPLATYCYTHNDLIFFGLACRLCGTRIIWRSQGEIFTPLNPLGHSWLGSFFFTVLKFINPHVVATTNGDIQRMMYAGLTLPNMGVIYLGAKNHGTPRKLDISADVPVRIGIFGRLVEWKGQGIFLKAMSELTRLGYEYEALIVGGSNFGDGASYEEALKKMAFDLGINDKIQFLGHRNDIQELMSSCHIICHCSEFEPFGMVIIEAMMAGRPVIASDLSGPRESIVNHKSGFLVEFGDHIQIAKKIAELVDNPTLANEIAAAARIRAENIFDLDKNLVCLNAFIKNEPSDNCNFGVKNDYE